MKGQEVKQILKDNGYTQTRIARDLGMNLKVLNANLNSEFIRIELLQRIAKAIKKDVSFFYNGGHADSKQLQQVNAVYKKTLKLYYATLKIAEDINRSLDLFNKQQASNAEKK